MGHGLRGPRHPPTRTAAVSKMAICLSLFTATAAGPSAASLLLAVKSKTRALQYGATATRVRHALCRQVRPASRVQRGNGTPRIYWPILYCRSYADGNTVSARVSLRRSLSGTLTGTLTGTCPPGPEARGRLAHGVYGVLAPFIGTSGLYWEWPAPGWPPGCQP